MTDEKPAAPAAGVSLFEAWKEHQQIAMHFNDLLMRLRSQSLAAVGALASVAGFAFHGQETANATNWHALFAAFGALCVFWVAIWILDFMYYNRLLLGAVNALVAIEKASAHGQTTLTSLDLSIKIEEAVANKGEGAAGRNSVGRWLFYVLVFAVLVTGLLLSGFRSGMLELRERQTATTPGSATRAVPPGTASP
jgi:hypothetical protein